MHTVIGQAVPEIALTETILSMPGVLAAIVAGTLVLGVLAWLLARAVGWYRLPAVLAAAGLSLALAVTLVRTGGHLPTGINPLDRCIRDSFSLHGSHQWLNFAMLMPFAFFGTIATRRPILIAAASALVSGGIEITQALTGLGVCEKQDFLDNSIGAALAAAAGWVALAIAGANGSAVRARAEKPGYRGQPVP